MGKLNVAMYGKVSQKESWIPVTASPLGDWVKLTPSEPLPPGEYAVVELLDKKQINLFVWDFGVNPDGAEQRQRLGAATNRTRATRERIRSRCWRRGRSSSSAIPKRSEGTLIAT